MSYQETGFFQTKKRKIRVCVFLPEETHAKLKEISEREKVKKSEVVITLIEAHHKRYSENKQSLNVLEQQ